ncbi:GumC family protein [Methylobacterium sp. J-067]|uniref:GumC family protein n=1 Tax=Methylobacterium sp. J-067 TaxID=2836648 RepID=UPI001FBC0A86|nr:GumC family protein [Methylobacterium sp. J-067]MCJ2027197.1 GumC family protein [Methylobacterium sp. J-067]
MTVKQAPHNLRKSLPWVVVPTALAALGSAVVVNVIPPRYTGETQLVLESREPAGRAAIDEQAAANQVMASRDIAREAIKRLKLVGNPEFDATAGEIGPVRQLMMLLGVGANPFDRPAEDRVTDAYFDHLTVSPAGKPRTLTVAFDATDPALAAEAANTVAQLYLTSLTDDRADTARSASTALNGTVAALRRKVAEAEAKAEAFRVKNGLVANAGRAGRPLSAQQLSEVSGQLAQARVQRADIAGRVAAIKDLLKDGRAYEITDVANNEMLRRTIETRITVRAQLALESRTLLPAHPRIKELKAQLEDLDAQIKTSAERTVRVLENDAKLADARVASLQAAVDGQQDTMVKGNAGDIELRALEREVKIQREQLDTALGRVREAEGAAPAEARILSRAVAPSVPSFPQKLPIVGFVTLLTLLLSLGGVLARTLRGKPAKVALPETRHEEAETVAPVAANPFLFPEAMPAKDWAEPVAAEAGSETEIEAETQPEPVAEAETVGETPVVEAEPAPVAAPVAVAAPADGFDLTPLIERLSRRPVIAGAPEGRMVVLMETDQAAMPTLAGALASAFGRDGSVLVVDLAGPDAASEQVGFTDVVCGDADFVEAIQADGPGGAHHVAAGIAPAGLLFEEPRALAFTLEAMAEAYEWVICRLRPQPEAAELLGLVATLADSVVIASNADPADETLADLYATALEAGAGQVLIAQDRPIAEPPADRHEELVFPEFHLKAA